MAIYGYARASTLEQNVTIQEDALRRAGCEVIRSEKVSGSSRAGRSELALLLQFLRHGDTLMVTRVDRLARSIKDLQDIVHELRAAGVTLRATEQPIDTSSAAGKAFLDMLGDKGVWGATERNPELWITFLMSSRIKCGVSGANVLWERTAADFTPHYPKTLLLSGDRLVGELDAR